MIMVYRTNPQLNSAFYLRTLAGRISLIAVLMFVCAAGGYFASLWTGEKERALLTVYLRPVASEAVLNAQLPRSVTKLLFERPVRNLGVNLWAQAYARKNVSQFIDSICAVDAAQKHKICLGDKDQIVKEFITALRVGNGLNQTLRLELTTPKGHGAAKLLDAYVEYLQKVGRAQGLDAYEALLVALVDQLSTQKTASAQAFAVAFHTDLLLAKMAFQAAPSPLFRVVNHARTVRLHPFSLHRREGAIMAGAAMGLLIGIAWVLWAAIYADARPRQK